MKLTGVIDWLKKTPVRLAAAKLVSTGNDESDPWRSIEVPFSPKEMGYRCASEVESYFSRSSFIDCDTPDALDNWLNNCSYVPRQDEDGVSLEWLHPVEFENNLAGSCADYALWSWRKLTEAGYSAQLMFGERYRDNEYRQHGWVVYKALDKNYLFEPLPEPSKKRIESLDNVRSKYIPWLSLTRRSKCQLHYGYVNAINRNVH